VRLLKSSNGSGFLFSNFFLDPKGISLSKAAGGTNAQGTADATPTTGTTSTVSVHTRLLVCFFSRLGGVQHKEGSSRGGRGGGSKTCGAACSVSGGTASSAAGGGSKVVAYSGT
jgi:hypothetical protein